MRLCSVASLVVPEFCAVRWRVASVLLRNLPTRWAVKPMRRSSPVNAWMKTSRLSTVQQVPPSILMMCFFPVAVPRRVTSTNTIHC